MGQYQSEFLAIGPTGPSFRWFVGILINRPNICILRPFLQDKISPQPNLQRPRDEEFESIIGVA
jgi:hypothetical protein